jgi:probable phosphoglycerate mutase
MGPADCYERVWANDGKNICPEETGVEPVESVLKRGLACIQEIEAAYRKKTILLVSHGDTLQILMTFFTGLPPYKHRELDHLDTAEIRKLSQG